MSFKNNILYELKSEVKLPGAILINGGWGSGKTHFWKRHIQPDLSKSNISTAYISFFGVNSAKKVKSDLLANFLLNSCGVGKNADDKFGSFTEMSKNIFKLAGKAANEIGKEQLGFDAIEIFKTLVPEVDPFEFLPANIVVCIDDFERCDPFFYKEAFNIVSQIIEHRNCKVIVLADLTKLKTGHDDYNEKVFHKSIAFKNDDLSLIFDHLVNRFSGSKSKKELTKFKNVILSVFQNAEVENLRTLGKVISYSSQLFENGLTLNDDYIKQLTFLLIFKSEKGKLISNFNLYKPSTGATLSYKVGTQKNVTKSDDDQIAIEFYERFYCKNPNDSIFSEHIFNFIATDQFNLEKLKNELNPPKNLDLAEKLCRSINSGNWIHLKEAELKKIIQDAGKVLNKNYSNHHSILMSAFEPLLEIHSVLGIDTYELETKMSQYLNSLPLIVSRNHIRYIQNEKLKPKIDKMYSEFTRVQIDAQRKAFIKDVVSSLTKNKKPELYNQYTYSNELFLKDLALNKKVVDLLKQKFRKKPRIFFDFYLTVTYAAGNSNWPTIDRKKIKENLDSIKNLDKAESNLMKILLNNLRL